MKTPYKSYSEQLKDPRWQKKRLEILERDDFTCQNCGDKEKTLHVHHRMYTKGKKPWEYDDRVLVTLCHECHEEWEHAKEKLDIALLEIDARSFLQVCADPDDDGAMFLMHKLSYAVAHSLYMREHSAACDQDRRANIAETKLEQLKKKGNANG